LPHGKTVAIEGWGEGKCNSVPLKIGTQKSHFLLYVDGVGVGSSAGGLLRLTNIANSMNKMTIPMITPDPIKYIFDTTLYTELEVLGLMGAGSGIIGGVNSFSIEETSSSVKPKISRKILSSE
jgi:hypothetical protein